MQGGEKLVAEVPSKAFCIPKDKLNMKPEFAKYIHLTIKNAQLFSS